MSIFKAFIAICTILLGGVFSADGAVAQAEFTLGHARLLDTPSRVFVNSLLHAPELREIGVSLKAAPGEQSAATILQGGLHFAVMNLTDLGRVNATSGAQESLPVSSFLTTPGISANSDSYLEKLNGFAGMMAEIEIGELGFVPLASIAGAPTNLATNRDDGDLDGARVRTIPTYSTAEATLRNLGASPVSIPFNDVANSVQTGAVDSAETLVDLQADIGAGLSQLKLRHMIGEVAPRPAFLVTGEKTWNSLSERQRHAFTAAAERAETASQSQYRETVAAQPSFAKELGFVSYETFADQFGAQATATLASNQWVASASRRVSDETAREFVNRATTTPKTPVAQMVGRTITASDRTVMFITTRNLENSADLRTRFGIDYATDKAMYCGLVAYSGHTDREMGDPFKGIVTLSDGLKSGTEDCATLFTTLAAEHGNHATLFFHGFNTDFDEALSRAVAIAHDLDIIGPLVLWSWPSLGKVGGYSRDGQRIAVDPGRLNGFLSKALVTDAAPQVDIIAHSMGSRLALQALSLLRAENKTVANTVFVAADTVQSDFVTQIASNGAASARTSLYFNRWDAALFASMFFNFSPAAGGGSHAITLAPGLDTIDVSDTGGGPFPHHNHAFNDPHVVPDARDLLRRRIAAKDRQLDQVGTAQAPYFKVRVAP